MEEAEDELLDVGRKEEDEVGGSFPRVEVDGVSLKSGLEVSAGRSKLVQGRRRAVAYWTGGTRDLLASPCGLGLPELRVSEA